MPSRAAASLRLLFSCALLLSPALADSTTDGSSSSDAGATFAALIHPITPLAFFQHHWERSSLFVDRSSSDASERYANHASSVPELNIQLDLPELRLLLDSGVSAFEELKPNSPPRMTSADLKLVKRTLAADGEWWSAMVPLDSLPASTPIDSRLVLQGIQRGFTLVLNRWNYRHASIAALCDLLQTVFGFRVQANLYVTPRNASGFEAHFDWQEAFVLQLAGSKRWTLMDPPLISLPRSDTKFKPKRAQMDELKKETLLLTQGSMLYFPSGVIHEATTEAMRSDESITRDSLKSEADQLASSHASSSASSATGSSPHGTSETEPLPPSVHLTLGVEIDPAFTMQGLLHQFLNDLAHSGDSTVSTALSSRLSIPACDLPASDGGMLLSELRNIDLLQLLVMQLSSEKDLPADSVVRDGVVPAHHFRRSLWGLHRWISAASQPALSASDLNESSEVASMLSADSAVTSAAFEHRTARRLAALLRSISVGIGIESSSDADDSAALTAALHFAASTQARYRAAEAGGAAPNVGGSAKQPAQLAYDFDSFFSDPVLLPFVQPALASAQLASLVAPMADGASTARCSHAYAVELSTQVRRAWTTVTEHLERSAQAEIAADAGRGDAIACSLPPVPSVHLRAALSTLQAHLAASNAHTSAKQRAHLHDNIARAAAYRQAAARLRAEMYAEGAAHVEDASQRDRMRHQLSRGQPAHVHEEFMAARNSSPPAARSPPPVLSPTPAHASFAPASQHASSASSACAHCGRQSAALQGDLEAQLERVTKERDELRHKYQVERLESQGRYQTISLQVQEIIALNKQLDEARQHAHSASASAQSTGASHLPVAAGLLAVDDMPPPLESADDLAGGSESFDDDHASDPRSASKAAQKGIKKRASSAAKAEHSDQEVEERVSASASSSKHGSSRKRSRHSPGAAAASPAVKAEHKEQEDEEKQLEEGELPRAKAAPRKHMTLKERSAACLAATRAPTPPPHLPFLRPTSEVTPADARVRTMNFRRVDYPVKLLDGHFYINFQQLLPGLQQAGLFPRADPPAEHSRAPPGTSSAIQWLMVWTNREFPEGHFFPEDGESEGEYYEPGAWGSAISNDVRLVGPGSEPWVCVHALHCISQLTHFDDEQERRSKHEARAQLMRAYEFILDADNRNSSCSGCEVWRDKNPIEDAAGASSTGSGKKKKKRARRA